LGGGVGHPGHPLATPLWTEQSLEEPENEWPRYEAKSRCASSPAIWWVSFSGPAFSRLNGYRRQGGYLFSSALASLFVSRVKNQIFTKFDGKVARGPRQKPLD